MKEANEIAQDLLQKAGYQLSDLISAWPGELRVFLLATMHCTVQALLPQLSELDRQVFQNVIDRTSTAILPAAMDPRRKAGGQAPPLQKEIE